MIKEVELFELDMEQLKREIRQEAERRKALRKESGEDSLTRVRSEGWERRLQIEHLQLPRIASSIQLESRSSGYELNDFLAYHDREFVSKAYRHLLGRGPDDSGLQYYLSRLRQGYMTKAEILGRLRFSNEGRRKRVRVRGLAAAFVIQSAYHIPIIGYLFRWINTMARLPVMARNLQILENSCFAQITALWEYCDSAHSLTKEKVNQIIEEQKIASADIEAAREEFLALLSQRSSQDDLNRKADREELASKADTAELERLREEKADKHSISRLTSEVNSYLSHIDDLKRTVLCHERQFRVLLDEARKAVAETSGITDPNLLDVEEAHSLDAFYAAFLDRFRGGKAVVEARSRVYLPFIEKAQAGTQERPILDLGCGRGEWLELIGEQGLIGQGIESNRVFVEECLKLGLRVEEKDIIGYLRSCPGESFGAVTAFHVVEHLPLKALIDLLDEIFRVLSPGGIAVFETPNPQNLLVGACNFYVDPTHFRPIHPEFFRFLLENRGLTSLEMLPLHPFEDEYRLAEDNSQAAAKINELLFGAQDYAFIGTKPWPG